MNYERIAEIRERCEEAMPPRYLERKTKYENI